MSIAKADIGQRIQRLQGRKGSIEDTCASLEKTIGVARARQAHREAVEGVLDDLEARFHARSLGMLEGLLSAFLNDVLPRDNLAGCDSLAGGDSGEQAVVLEMDTQRGLPALQIQVRNGAHLEDALRGRGGSVANVLSAGLRFVALSRAEGASRSGFAYRPFLILDEADCWLAPERVPAFSEVVYQLARDMGLQVLVISHHAACDLKGFPVHLERVVANGKENGSQATTTPANGEGTACPSILGDASHLGERLCGGLRHRYGGVHGGGAAGGDTFGHARIAEYPTGSVHVPCGQPHPPARRRDGADR